MAERRVIRPDYDEKFTVEEPLTYEEAVERLLGAPVDEVEMDDSDGDIEVEDF